MASSEDPLSLEDQCLLYLVHHLEEYTPETLASLPLHLRRRLLLNLPAVDVCQLEDTAVTDGIDMEVSVWKALLGSRVDHERLTIYRRGCLKQSYFDIVAECLVDGGDDITAESLLFSVPRSLGTVGHCGAPSGWHSMPERHTQQSYSQVEMMALIVDRYKQVPCSISVNCGDFIRTELWQSRSLAVSLMLKDFLATIHSISLVEVECEDDESYRVPQYIFELVLSSAHPVLKSLSLCGEIGFLRHAIAAAAAVFSPPSCIRNHSQSVYPRLVYPGRLPNTPYSNLTSISVFVREDLPEEEVEPHYQLESVIRHQSSLTSVDLTWDAESTELPSSTAAMLSLYEALGCLFDQPQFRKLKLALITLTWSRINALIPKFLTSSTPPNHDVLLHFHEACCYNLQNERPPDSGELVVPSNMDGFPCRALVFDSVFIDPNDPSPRLFFTWLSKFLSACSLSSFTYSYSDILGSGIRMGNGVMTLFANHKPSAQLEEVNIRRVSNALPLAPEGAFENLFSGPSLKRVFLNRCQIGQEGLLPALTQGLLKQASGGVLEVLELDGNDLGISSDAELEMFFDVIFSLPQLSKLTLSLRYNRMGPQHFSLMYDSWRRCAAMKKMKHVCVGTITKCSRRLASAKNRYTEHITELQAIAVTCR